MLGHVLSGQHAYDQTVQSMVLPANADDYRDFLARCLRFHPQNRPDAKDLLVHPFLLNRTTDRKSLQSALRTAMMHRKKAAEKK